MISTKDLEQQYINNKDPKNWIKLITRLTKEFNYRQAYIRFNTLDNATIREINPHLVLRILLNSELINPKTQNLTIIEDFIADFRINNLINEAESQRYRSLLLLIQKDKDNFILNLPRFDSTSTSEVKGVVDDIHAKINQSKKGNDIPVYYTDGMIALSLFQYGYPYLAQQMSLSLLVQYPHYILPQQILAYSHMILHEWSQAQSYFLTLMTNDTNNIHNYQFFAWVCAYRLERYTDSILYLDQIPSDKLISDIVRYKILSYIAIQDHANTAKQMKQLLSKADINNSDMMLVWENTVFKPYMDDESYNILQKDNTVLDIYIDRCISQWLDATVCQIGQLAKNVNLRTTDYSDKYLKDIVEKFPRSYIYYLLWEYYLKIGNKNDAQKSFITALSLSTERKVKDKITNKIKSIL
jgi:hypothetical protein